jgi:hypothetical protein
LLATLLAPRWGSRWRTPTATGISSVPFEEQLYVLSNAVGFDLLDIQEKGVIWACFSTEAGRKYYRKGLPA